MKSVVFVLDELDAFTRKGKQVLLYNLLDTLSHSKVQVWEAEPPTLPGAQLPQ